MSELYANLNLGTESIPSEGNVFSIFPGPGIVENNKIVKAEVATTKTDVRYIKVEFINENGATLSFSEFPIDAERTEQSKIKGKLENQLKRLKHILTKYYPENAIPKYGTFEALVGSIKSFNDLANIFVTLLSTPAVKATPVRLKVVYNYNNYKSLPSYVPFIENSSVPVEETRLKIDGSFDKIVKDVVETDKPEDLASAPNTDDDLPF